MDDILEADPEPIERQRHGDQGTDQHQLGLTVMPDDRHLELPLTKDEVLAAASRWGGQRRPAWLSQWSAIKTIADDTWRAWPTSRNFRRLWVFLVYSIGNFKRQGNTGIFPFASAFDNHSGPSGSQTGTLDSPPQPSDRDLRKGTTEHLSHLRGLASAPPDRRFCQHSGQVSMPSSIDVTFRLLSPCSRTVVPPLSPGTRFAVFRAGLDRVQVVSPTHLSRSQAARRQRCRN